MFEPLIQIPGPTFLLVYGAAAVLGVLVARLWADADGSTAHSPPAPDALDAYALADLRGGAPDVIRTAMFDLYERGAVTLDAATGEFKRARPLTAAERAEPLAAALYDALAAPTAARQLFSSAALRAAVTALLRPRRNQLERLHLTRTADDRRRTARAGLAVGAVLLLFGGAKLCLGLTRHRPSVFLVLLLFATVVALIVALPRGAASQLGRQVLANARDHFAWVGHALLHGERPAGVDPALGVALFGVSTLGGFALYDNFRGAFREADTGWSGAACGGGGGCGGGGCGGGGCGGCGGG